MRAQNFLYISEREREIMINNLHKPNYIYEIKKENLYKFK